MALNLYNDGLDDTPATASAPAFLGADFATQPSQLAPELIQAGENVWADDTGHLVTRPGLRWIAHCHDPATLPTDAAAQGIAYYDTPLLERVVMARAGLLHAVAGDQAGAAVEQLDVALDPEARVRFAQLVDRLHYVDGSTSLRWSYQVAGLWQHGAVATFSSTAAMPTWGGIVAHNLRLFAWPHDGSRLYASGVGAASAPANWTATDNLRFGVGEGDPIVAAISAQNGNLIVLTQQAAYAVDTRAAAVAEWTITAITRLVGCAAADSVLAIGQDVLFLSRYGVVKLGALSDDISINPAATISAPMQPLIDRINWTRRDRIHATVWRDLYLLALPLDTDDYPTIWLGYNLRTRRWTAPWSADLGPIYSGELGTASLLADEAGNYLVDELGNLLLDGPLVRPLVDELGNYLVDELGNLLTDDGVPALRGPTMLDAPGWSAACISRFGDRQETLLADANGRLLRLDVGYSRDDSRPDASAVVESWATLKAFDFDTPDNPKQPFRLELVFSQSLSPEVWVAIVPDSATAWPDIPDAERMLVDPGFITGTFGRFPIIFPLRFRANTQTRKAWHLRTFPRFRDLAVQVHSSSGRMRLRSATLAAFVDSPDLT
jgi:hypothetical protein